MSRPSTSTRICSTTTARPGLQDVVSTRATYFAGQAAMIVWSPFIMDEMAGLRDAALPTCPECADNIAFLAENSDFVPAFAGPSGAPAQYGQVSNMGIGVTDEHRSCRSSSSSTGSPTATSTGCRCRLRASSRCVKAPPRTRPSTSKDGRRSDHGVDRQAPLSDFYAEDVINGLITGIEQLRSLGLHPRPGRAGDGGLRDAARPADPRRGARRRPHSRRRAPPRCSRSPKKSNRSSDG